MVGNGMGAKHGTMFKTAVSLEETGKTQIVALDKTGTITSGEPQVTDLVPADGVSEEELLKGAFALEHKSEHPLARAILALAEEKGLAAKKSVISLRSWKRPCGKTERKRALRRQPRTDYEKSGSLETDGRAGSKTFRRRKDTAVLQ